MPFLKADPKNKVVAKSKVKVHRHEREHSRKAYWQRYKEMNYQLSHQIARMLRHLKHFPNDLFCRSQLQKLGVKNG